MATSLHRQIMVDRHIRARGITDPRVLAAMAAVQREDFLPPDLAEFAYEDQALPIEEGQTISQPYIVALMADAAKIETADNVLEIGTGSGYAAAVLAKLAAHVYTIERHSDLANTARERLSRLGYHNVDVRCADGTLGWLEHAPYQAIIVAAGGPDVPRALLDQLAVGGRLVIPVGSSHAQDLVRVTRRNVAEFDKEDLGSVRFVPLIGEQGWSEPEKEVTLHPANTEKRASRPASIAKLIRECAEPLTTIEDASVDSLIERIGDAHVVLLGEATHGTSEFYRMRTRITQELIRRRGFRAVAVEADWPDASVIDRYVRGKEARPRTWIPFMRFPTWMWRNREVGDLVEWMRDHNAQVHEPELKVSFSGLDFYSLFTSAYEVVRYLDRVDPIAAQAARERYGQLTPWQDDPAAYGRAALVGRMKDCESEVVAMLRDLLAKRIDYSSEDGDEFFDAAQNARVVAGAERYYRIMYYGGAASWNLRDQHMFDTLRLILMHRGPDAKIIVWEHNSHIGDASATEMSARNEHNVGQLCRAAFGDDMFNVGFGTDHGTVAAAHDWDGPMEQMVVRPSREDSYERLCHDSEVPAFMLHLREPRRQEIRDELFAPRLERAIGVVYRPMTELQSHYFQAVLPAQFDEYVWFDETRAVTALPIGDDDFLLSGNFWKQNSATANG
jgi:protein-L-isoaspartate(D-aspartate) O-methyltransferase